MKFLILAALILTLSAQIVVAQTSPNPSTSATVTPIPAIEFSLSYPNGTAFPTSIVNCLSVVDIRYARGGVSPSGEGGRIFTAKNDGNIPINITISSQNVNMPSNLQFIFNWGNYYGTSNSPITIAVGQAVTLYFIAEVLAGGNYNNEGQWILNYTAGALFNYKYEVNVTAAAADPTVNPSIVHYQDIILVTGIDVYPGQTTQPNPSPTPIISPSSSPTSSTTQRPSSSSATTTPTEIPIPSPTSAQASTPFSNSNTTLSNATSNPALEPSFSPSPSIPEVSLMYFLLIIGITFLLIVGKKVWPQKTD